jgi:hypothetical protein
MLLAVAEKLTEKSIAQGVRPELDWPASKEAFDGAWCMSPELVSLHGTPAWDALTLAEQQKLAFHECANFFALNIHGERALMEGLAKRLYKRDTADVSHYIHHFLAEENQHMTWFGGWCRRYAGGIYPDRKVTLPRSYAPGEEDLLFFAKVMVFELVVDAYNQRMAKDERLHPLVREINRRHHEDESRHLAFGRLVVEDLWTRHAARWTDEVKAAIRTYMAAYLEATWREYYNPDVYKDAGLADPYRIAREAFAAPAARARRDEIGARCTRVLRELELL